MSIVWTIIAFIVIFALLVIVHEFGHFIVAKANGIQVNEFAVGMGPKIFKFTKTVPIMFFVHFPSAVRVFLRKKILLTTRKSRR